METVHGRYIIRTTALEGFRTSAGKWAGHWLVYDTDFGPQAEAIGEGEADVASTFDLAITLAHAEAVGFIERLEGRGEVTGYRDSDTRP